MNFHQNNTLKTPKSHKMTAKNINTISSTIYLEMAQPQSKYIRNTYFYSIYLFVYQLVIVVAPRLRFGCATVALDGFGCATLIGYSEVAQPKALVAPFLALWRNRFNSLYISVLDAKKRLIFTPVALVAPKKD